MRITKVYTKTGDKGQTSLVGGVRISKSDIRLESYGTVDELNAHIGLLCTEVSDDTILSFLYRIQSNLFVVGTHLATDQSQTPLYASAILDVKEIEVVEKEIDSILIELPESTGFVLPGGGKAGALCHVCRTICRRAERRVISLSEQAIVGEEIMRYLNRLSDYFYVLSKKLNIIDKIEEKTWYKPCK